MIHPAERTTCWPFVLRPGYGPATHQCRLRCLALAELRAQLKKRKLRQATLAYHCNKSLSWVSTVLNGHYPFYGAGLLTQGLKRALIDYRFTIPPELQ